MKLFRKNVPDELIVGDAGVVRRHFFSDENRITGRKVESYGMDSLFWRSCTMTLKQSVPVKPDIEETVMVSDDPSLQNN